MDFSDLGWCDRGAKCTQRHTWDCPEFLREGKCSRKGCKLMHVIRVDNLKKREEEEEDEHELADDDLFVRDDEAAEGGGQKRKREASEEGEDEGEEDREHSPTWKPKKTRDFVRQQDFISFTDDEEEGEEEEEKGSQGSEDDSSEEDDHESVHSDSSQE